MKTTLFIFGTRPEAIKMCPLILEMKKDSFFNVKVCVTSQHKEMLIQVLDTFKIKPDYDLQIMKKDQTLCDITCSILSKINRILDIEKPDIVLVHGDTSTTFAAALSCFYKKIKIGHVEAGLRTNNIFSPFPEEFNREAVSLISYLNFAPTKLAADNLINEGKNKENIIITGNTAIDALKTTIDKGYTSEYIEWAKGSKLIMLTCHRRENLGTPMEEIFKAINYLANIRSDIRILYPIHKNHVIRDIAYKHLGSNKNIKIIEPLNVVDFHNLINHSYLILTDSGGIQEEAPSLGKPVLVLRDTTERPEGVLAGTLKVIGTSFDNVVRNTLELLDNKDLYSKMSAASNPYGDGHACERICAALKERLL